MVSHLNSGYLIDFRKYVEGKVVYHEVVKRCRPAYVKIQTIMVSRYNNYRQNYDIMFHAAGPSVRTHTHRDLTDSDYRRECYDN